METYSADIVVVSAGAINSAALLLRSANDQHPNGLANSSDQVGRNYMGHVNSVMLAVSKCRNTTVFQKTLGVNDFYFGSEEFPYSMGHISFGGKLDGVTLSAGAPSITPGFTLDLMAKHSLDSWLTTEDLPRPENRVTLNQDGAIVLSYTPNNVEAHKQLQKKLKTLMNNQRNCDMHGAECHQGIFARNLYLAEQIPLAGVAHQNGTLRFGDDPSTSVLDSDCKAHDIHNLYVVDGSLFSVKLGRKSGAHDHGERITGRATFVGKDELMKLGKIQQNVIRFEWLIIVALSILAFLSTAHGQTATRVETVGFTVSDMDKALDFYTRVLPFEKVSDTEIWGTEFEHLSGIFGSRARVVDLKIGDEKLELTEYLTPQGRAIPVDSRSNDRWFQHVAIIVSDMDKAYQMLRANKVRHASTVPQTLPAYITAAAGIRAFYFKDPDNHVLEILQFPADKGAAQWRERAASGKLFLGIDHTAIVVDNTDESLKFYRDTLGLTVAGTSDNYGAEQEHLNNVFGAKLHITGLRTKIGGVAIEFLEYVAPRDGRPFPRDTKSSDLWHWETSFAANDIEKFFANYKADFISSGLVLLPRLSLGFKKVAMFRDPDGHAVRLIEN